MPEEAGEIDHVRRYGDEESDNQHLVFTDIPDPVNRVHERNDGESEERREQPGCKVRRTNQGKYTCCYVIEERPVVTGVVLPYTSRQELVAEPGMDSFVMVEEFEVKLPEAEDECKDEDEYKSIGCAGTCHNQCPTLSTLQSRPSHSQMPYQNPEYRESGGPAKPATERQTDPASPAGARDLP
ncbi:MAG: hypothetical protein A4E33_00011 [Methanoregula sp. PtaB.Bin085]|nr:MAG: hypothetical protein A4E33_00011 [Methanoregula sp. PtaB.Bin085]